MSPSIASRAPLLVTGMPRSGTTWLARLLASAPGTALTGREPMNPRGRQYALAGTLDGWARLEEPNSRQSRGLRSSYRGFNPLVYSRYGHRQWAALLPGTRIVVKDPFAMLSIPAVHRLTGATSLLLFRHPGAALTSYRRMGWSPDVAEIEPIIADFTVRNGPQPGVAPPPGNADETGLMAWFWNALYGIALFDADRLGSVVVVAHEDVAEGGESFARGLFHHLDLTWDPRIGEQLSRRGAPRQVDMNALHNFDRNPAQVAREWETKVNDDERAQLERETRVVLGMLRERAFHPQGERSEARPDGISRKDRKM